MGRQKFREKLESRKNGSHPGLTVGLTVSQAERLEGYITALEGRLEDLEFMRGIAMDMLAFMEGNQIPPEGMLRAFSDALEFKHPKQKGGEK